MNTNETIARELELRAFSLENTAQELRAVAERLRGTETEDHRPLLSIKEASAQYGLSVFMIRQLLDQGRLKDIRSGNRRYVTRESLEVLGREAS